MQRKLKTALDETRMLMMGTQILFGFQLEAVFHENFGALDEARKALTALATILMAVTIGMLIAPSCRHRLLEDGEASPTMLKLTTRCAAVALLLFATSLGCDLVVVLGAGLGGASSIISGLIMVVLAMGVWFALALILKGRRERKGPMEEMHHEKLGVTTKIEQMLTEARVILPGAQALFGFQLIVMLTPTFTQLPREAKLVHAIALLCVALTIILLMAPAAIHRLAFNGEDTPRILRIGSRLVTAALLPLSLGLAADIYVAVGHSLDNETLGIATGVAILTLLLSIWYAWPLLVRARNAVRRRPPASLQRSGSRDHG